MNTLAFLAAGIASAALVATAAHSAELAAPTGEVVLTVSGEIGTKNVDDTAQFDMEGLAALPVTTFKTATIWTEGVNEFTGVALKDLAEAVGMEGTTIRATAINDYAVEVPLSDAVEGGPIVAYAMNGEPMSVRDKGPLWIVYPYDQNTDYQTEVIYSRSIWQLDRIEVLK